MGALAALCLLAYWRFLSLPFLSDDYLAIKLGREYTAPGGWSKLASDALYRCRATSIVLTYWLDGFFGLNSTAYNSCSLILHILNTWLVFTLGFWRPIGWRLGAVAAGFFAIHEGHQEAVVWFSASPELLVFFFTLLGFLCWLGWVEGAKNRAWYYGGTLVCFLLAMLSKESAVAFVPVLLLPLLVRREKWRRVLIGTIPFAATAVIYTLLIFAARENHLHFNDGTFSPGAPFWVTLAISAGRMLWFWGLLSLAFLAIERARQWKGLLAGASLWIVATLLPYAFLTYMPRVPSRHTYLASVGVAFIVAAGMAAVRRRFAVHPRLAVAIVAIAVIAHNCGYLWTRKYFQYTERAAPTSELVRLVEATDGPVFVHGFPYDKEVAYLAVEVGANKPRNTLIFDSRRAVAAKAVYTWKSPR